VGLLDWHLPESGRYRAFEKTARLGNETIRNHSTFIWQVADLLRGDYKQSDYGRVMLPLTAIRRLDCVLEPTKAKVLQRHQQLAENIDEAPPANCSIWVGPVDVARLNENGGDVHGKESRAANGGACQRLDGRPVRSSSSTGQTIVGSTTRARRLYARHAPVSESRASATLSGTRSSSSTSRALSARRASFKSSCWASVITTGD